MKTLDNPKFAAVVTHFENACRASRKHSQFATQSLKLFGDHGSTISGCVRDHFSDSLKNELRDLARLVTTESDAAYAARAATLKLCAS